jgi:hypothetical protein
MGGFYIVKIKTPFISKGVPLLMSYFLRCFPHLKKSLVCLILTSSL